MQQENKKYISKKFWNWKGEVKPSVFTDDTVVHPEKSDKIHTHTHTHTHTQTLKYEFGEIARHKTKIQKLVLSLGPSSEQSVYFLKYHNSIKNWNTYEYIKGI